MQRPATMMTRRMLVAQLAMLTLVPRALAEDHINRDLDTLFIALRNARNADAAARISTRIWRHWLRPKNPVLLELMTEAVTANAMGNITRSMQILGDITTHYPDYAEAWNLRATLYFEQRDFAASLADIAETLKHEPRHYGALSGRAMIYLALGEAAKARQTILETLKIHPFIAEHPPFSDLVKPTVRL